MNDIHVGYEGRLRVRKYKRGKLKSTKYLYNEGTWELFNFLCIALASEDTSGSAPSILDAGYYDNNGNFHSILSASKPLLTVLELENTNSNENKSETNFALNNLYNSCSITFRAVLTAAHVVTEHSPAKVYYALCASNNVVYAVTDANEGSSLHIEEDEVYLIDWTLELGNGEVYSTPEHKEDNGEGAGGTQPGGGGESE